MKNKEKHGILLLFAITLQTITIKIQEAYIYLFMTGVFSSTAPMAGS